MVSNVSTSNSSNINNSNNTVAANMIYPKVQHSRGSTSPVDTLYEAMREFTGERKAIHCGGLVSLIIRDDHIWQGIRMIDALHPILMMADDATERNLLIS